MDCSYCYEEVENGIVKNGLVFCNDECAEKLRRKRADNKAMAEGFFSYEDMMEHKGINCY